MAIPNISDKIRKKSILEKFDLLSANQLNAHMKICDIWKAINMEIYPTKVFGQVAVENSRSTRSITSGKLIEYGT